MSLTLLLTEFRLVRFRSLNLRLNSAVGCVFLLLICCIDVIRWLAGFEPMTSWSWGRHITVWANLELHFYKRCCEVIHFVATLLRRNSFIPVFEFTFLCQRSSFVAEFRRLMHLSLPNLMYCWYKIIGRIRTHDLLIYRPWHYRLSYSGMTLV